MYLRLPGVAVAELAAGYLVLADRISIMARLPANPVPTPVGTEDWCAQTSCRCSTTGHFQMDRHTYCGPSCHTRDTYCLPLVDEYPSKLRLPVERYEVLRELALVGCTPGDTVCSATLADVVMKSESFSKLAVVSSVEWPLMTWEGLMTVPMVSVRSSMLPRMFVQETSECMEEIVV